MDNSFKHFILGLFLFFMNCLASAQVHTIRITVPADAGMIASHARHVLAQQITSRCNARVVEGKTADLTIELVTEKTGEPESYFISDNGAAHIRIIGGDENGLIYGAGKFLRSSRFDKGGFTPGAWRGSSVPAGKVRGMYFASHFGNFYEAAPIEEVQRYVDELALWGVNYLVVHYPEFQFTGFDDPAAQQLLERLRQILRVARSGGMKVGLLQVPNGSFKSTPKELLNVPVPDQLHRRGNFGVNLNPANPVAHQLLRKEWAALLDQFKSVGLDAIVYWPYDEGGCGCSECWPWGARGFPKLSRDLSKIAQAKYPGIKIVLSTWVFDTPGAGEWEGLSQFLQKDKGWVNYIMADSHEGFPRYPLDKGVPGGLPMLNFPEISMWGQEPWGGYGANPLTNRLQRLWNETDNKLSGGFPYSEGIFEDINKVICNQLYWNGQRSTADIVREYIAYEFSPDVVEPVAKALEIFESNHYRENITAGVNEAFQLIEQAELKLTSQVRKSWRWRIVYLRALIDREMFATKGKLEGETLKKAFSELTAIYHAEHGHSMPIHPPVIQ
ncbi:hypothetical protein [Flavihumibacter fluvii]|uniref:hypothetical protein n=1 Tax=Flavihumibacter fluvii TaxID=2838157 RepID=UPI001BDF2293|nr:hypothetical protein [Flavihumibacter fluvii]ULQ54715.1 hypothetical protein KJS93_10335 [Flavihumibacter fluvii]